MLIDMSMHSKSIMSRSTQSHRAKYLILMCQVWGVDFCALVKEVQPSLSLYAMVAASCGMSKSRRMILMKRHISLTSQAAINSASVDDNATVG